jgi:hypothetical protein
MTDKKPESQTETDAIKGLQKILEGRDASTLAASGACVYSAGSKTYCAVLTEAECSVLKGTWVSGGKCP